LHEINVKNAADYVGFAERAIGRIPRPLGFDYIWGDALDIWEREEPCRKIINLETAITLSNAH
jgi:poly-gamma-glutamate synthesis protein (capsule biosynthesis protein)